jgi:hypothetical protein
MNASMSGCVFCFLGRLRDLELLVPAAIFVAGSIKAGDVVKVR